MLRLFAAHVVVVTLMIAAPAETFGGIRSTNKNVKSGVRALVYSLSSWDAKCRHEPLEVKIITPPRHGVVTTGISKGVFKGANFRNATDCRGKVLPKINIYYESNRGFAGNDLVQINTYKPGKPFDNEIINVRIRVNR